MVWSSGYKLCQPTTNDSDKNGITRYNLE